MADWQEISRDAGKALQKVDSAHQEVDLELKAAYRNALGAGRIDDAEKERINDLKQRRRNLNAARDPIVSAVIEALDSSADVRSMRPKFLAIRRRLENRKAELRHVEKAANLVGEALQIVSRILLIL